MTGRRRTPMLTGPADELMIPNEGQLAGPGFLWALAATQRADTRTVTPLVNVVPVAPYLETYDYAPVRYFKRAPDSTVYHLSLRYLFHAYGTNLQFAVVFFESQVWFNWRCHYARSRMTQAFE